MGVLAQLMPESAADEATRAAGFFAAVGLPVHLAQLGLSAEDDADLDAVLEAAMAFPFLGNMPFEVTLESLKGALLAADRLGRDISPE